MIEPEERQALLTSLESAVQRGDLDRIIKHLIEAEAHLGDVLRNQRGTEATLDAREMIRLVERHLGLGVRRGQEAGVIETPREAATRVLLEGRQLTAPSSHKVKVKVRDVMPGLSKVFHLAVGTAAQFDAAVATSRERRKMGRDDLARELARLVAAADLQRPEDLRGRRRLDVNQVIAATIGASGISESIEAQLDWEQLDLSRADEFYLSLTDVVNSLNRLRGRIKRRANAAQASRGSRR